jgi:hypothetical protein
MSTAAGTCQSWSRKTLTAGILPHAGNVKKKLDLSRKICDNRFRVAIIII